MKADALFNRRVMRVFEDMLDQPPAARDGRLYRTLGGEPAIHDAVHLGGREALSPFEPCLSAVVWRLDRSLAPPLMSDRRKYFPGALADFACGSRFRRERLWGNQNDRATPEASVHSSKAGARRDAGP